MADWRDIEPLVAQLNEAIENAERDEVMARGQKPPDILTAGFAVKAKALFTLILVEARSLPPIDHTPKSAIVLRVPGEPVGKARHRTTRRGKRYTPSKTVAYEKKIKLAFMEAGGQMFNGPVCISVAAYFQVPASASKRRQALMRAGEILPTKRPDGDNILKIVMDALNKLAYADDAYVTTALCVKRYGDPRVEITIYPSDEGDPQLALDLD